MKTFKKSQSFFIDCFRIVAAFFVLIGHSGAFMFENPIFCNEDTFPIQNLGVVMLFVLAGFLCAMSVDKVKGLKYSSFIIKKIKRLWPEYILAINFVALVDLICLKYEGYDYVQQYNLKNYIGNLLMLQGMGIGGKPFNIEAFGSARPLWTLSIEFWFILFGGYLIYLIKTKKRINSISILVMVLYMFICGYFFSMGSGNGLGICFALGIGSWFVFDLIEICSAFWFVVGTVATLGGCCFFHTPYIIYVFLLVSFTFVAGFLLFDNIKINENISYICSMIAKSTFMLYLIHYSVIYYLVVRFGYKGIQGLWLSIVCVLVCTSFLRIVQVRLCTQIKNVIVKTRKNNVC